jgi:hypothetical protein
MTANRPGPHRRYGSPKGQPRIVNFTVYPEHDALLDHLTMQARCSRSEVVALALEFMRAHGASWLEGRRTMRAKGRPSTT